MAAADKVTTAPRQHWPHEATELYLREADRIEAINGPFGDVMLDTAALQPGERVLDVGLRPRHHHSRRGPASDTSGRGPRRRHHRVACVEQARQRASTAGISNVEFVTADAQTHPFHEAAFDVVISRFGIMFFDEPEAAFANLGPSRPARWTTGHRLPQRPAPKRMGRHRLHRRGTPRRVAGSRSPRRTRTVRVRRREPPRTDHPERRLP